MKLKPCPFCGGKPKRSETPEGGHYIECRQCNASSTLMFPDKCDVSDLLAERWNNRAPARGDGNGGLAEAVAELEAAARAVSELEQSGRIGTHGFGPDGGTLGLFTRLEGALAALAAAKPRDDAAGEGQRGLIDALKWYANPAHYEEGAPQPPFGDGVVLIHEDKGAMARAALAATTGGSNERSDQ